MKLRILTIGVACLLLSMAAGGEIIDRIAAVIDNEVITASEVEQFAALRIIPRNPGESDSDYRRRLLDAMVAQSLRYRDLERFGSQDVGPDAVEARRREIIARFASEQEFLALIASLELSEEEVRGIISRQLQVEAYIEERFSPRIFVPNEEIETYYQKVWLPQRRERGLPPVALGEVREEIRRLARAGRLQTEIERWTTQLRSRANVDIFLFR